MAPPVTRQTRYGHQPIRDVVWRAGLSHSHFAELIGVRPANHIRFAMYGLCPPSQEFRRAAVEFLGIPLEELFTPEALAARYQPHRPRRAETFKAKVSAR